MTDLNLDDVRLKDLDELSSEEKGFLNEHAADLTDDEKEIFNSVIKKAEPPPTEEPSEEFKFKSATEFEEKVGSVLSRVLKENQPPPKPPGGEEPPKTEKIFAEQPKDWEEAGQRIVSAVEEKLVRKNEEVRERVKKINEEYDQEIVDIRSANPEIPVKGTKEGDEFETKLAEIGVKFRGVTTMNEAFEIYKALDAKKEEPPDKQVSLASKVGKSGGASAPPTEHKYSRIAGKSMDELLEEEMASKGIA